MVVHGFNPSTWDVQVQGCAGLHRQRPCPRNRKKLVTREVFGGLGGDWRGEVGVAQVHV